MKNMSDEARDAARYRYLRNRPEDTIGKGGLFAGSTPPTGQGGFILTEDDLDRAVDAAMSGGSEIVEGVRLTHQRPSNEVEKS